jgi:hypothetical protein
MQGSLDPRQNIQVNVSFNNNKSVRIYNGKRPADLSNESVRPT